MDEDKTLPVEYIEGTYDELEVALLEGVNTLKQLCDRFPELAECRIYDV